MFWNDLRKALVTAVLSLVMLASLGAGPLGAAEAMDIRSSCWTSGSLSEDLSTVVHSSGRWTCGDRSYSLEGERTLLRFEVGPTDALPQYFFSRRSALAAVHLLAIDRDGAMRQTSLPAGELPSALRGGYFKAPLPDVTRETVQVVVAIDLPSHQMTLERAYLSPSDIALGPDLVRSLIILAILAGMLSMPLIFNAAFYRILREPFVLWHSMLTISLLLTILVSSGLAAILFDPPAMTLSWLTTVIFGFTVASGAMFTHSFIEPGRLHPLLRRALLWCAIWAMFLSTSHAAFPFVGRSFQSTAYTAAFAPVVVIFILSVADALRRGSRAARFQAVGYIPVIMVGLVRLVTGVVPGLESNDAMLLFYVGCVCEVLFTTLGVADRFMTIKRQRDSARFEADMLERLSERDALTGLLNRRAIEQNFERFRAEGYRTLAVLDLDHFKAINDVHGHVIGDAVLKAVAEALQADPQVHAFRLGGEEFVLLVRGEDAQLHAERRRQAIPAVVANAVPGLGRPVTASMGMTDASLNADMEFAKLYEQADRLLYNAKLAGRNRTQTALAQGSKDDAEPVFDAWPDRATRVMVSSGGSAR
ncbi:diguanylate cyclase [Aminobacter sp. MET-1]|uniref:sensor domain-containing diguanylate cyclase n=1 Tax=Aminobacter sp. MET-1 TaxID=2951085 RepID=UPI00226AB157|nr:diguanylate cyclase [Aminobacter sp. MET-1]MCX8567634.1 GGDEF domain-containing protein [Aminobacter sp. MET-1]